MGDVRLTLDRPPSLIVVDWGASTLRATLLDETGAVVESRSEPWGILHVPSGDFEAAFRHVAGGWNVPAIAAGMIGSANGWLEVPYCSAPARAEDLIAGIRCIREGLLHIVPGVAQFGDRPDVMRGEETQIVGALDLHPELQSHSTLVLPGTHSKWARINDGHIAAFSTYMTGELFAVLRDHSILGRFPGTSTLCAESEAFSRGVAAAAQSPRGIAPVLFSARAAVLAQTLAAADSLDYLSGLLIGDECCAALSAGAQPDALVGDAELCGRYRRALQLLGVQEVPIIDDAARAGLWYLARRAGIVE